jgi:cation diffusion facilitator family transporter
LGINVVSIFEKITDKIAPPNSSSVRRNRSQIGKLQGWVSVAINGLLFFLKMAIGVVVGSISIMADAIHTLSDVISSAVVIWGFNEAEKPPDKEHPYGHGRAEYIATLIIAILLCVAGIEFIQSSIDRILHPEPINPAWWMISVIFLTVILKELTARYAEFLAEKISSGTLKADAWHHRTDAISSLLVIVALIASRFGYSAVDGWAGLGVALFIIWTGFTIAKESVDDLLGSPPTEEEIEEIRYLVKQIHNVLGVHDITIHSYGKEQYISVHIEVDESESTPRTHDIAEEVEEHLFKELGVEPTVHIDPIGLNNPMVYDIKSFLNKNWMRHESISDIHDVRVVDTEKHHVILLGITFEKDLRRTLRHSLCDEMRKSIEARFAGFDADLKVSPIHRF